MMTQKPDRFERDVLRALKKHGVPLDPDGVTISLIGPDVVKLLRKHHRSVMRIIQAMQANSCSFNEVDAYVNGYQQATYDLLSKLTERAR